MLATRLRSPRLTLGALLLVLLIPVEVRELLRGHAGALRLPAPGRAARGALGGLFPLRRVVHAAVPAVSTSTSAMSGPAWGSRCKIKKNYQCYL